MTDKLIEKITLIHNQIEVAEKEIFDSFADSMDKSATLNLGAKGLAVQANMFVLFDNIDTFLTIAGGKIEDLPENVQETYNTFKELSKPSSEIQSEDLKKFKDEINKLYPNESKL